MDTAIALVIAALATARITRLITTDEIFRAPRSWLLGRLRAEGLAAYLLVCPWCMGMWVGAATAALGAFAGAWPWLWAPGVALAFSYTTGWLAGREGEDG